MENWYRASWNIVVKALGSDTYNGLKAEEIEKRRAAYGSNVIEFEDSGKAKTIIKSLFQYWFIAALIDSFILYSEKQYVGMILLLIVSMGAIIYQNGAFFKQYSEFLKIKSMNKDKVRVIRSGRGEYIESSDIVVGDIVKLHSGESVPADIRIIECEKLKVMEGNITGDSRIAEKYATKIEEQVNNIGNIKNMLFKSSKLVGGNCQGIVVAVGKATAAFATLKAMEKANPKKDGILERCKNTYNIHLMCTVFISLAAALITYLSDSDKQQAFNILKLAAFLGSFYGLVFVAGMIAAAVKLHLDTEEIHVLTTSAVLKIPKINVNISEKHGVISEKNMVLREIYTDKLTYSADVKKEDWNSNITRVFNAAIFCNNSIEKNLDEDYNFMIDRGLSFYIENVLKYEVQEFSHQRKFVIPYDHERRVMTAVYKVEGKYRSYTKGLLEYVINNCTFIMRNGLETELLKEDIEHARNKAVKMESKGLTVVALAYRSFNYEPAPGANIESNMVFVGLVALDNYMLDNAKEYIQDLRHLGIKPVFFTEDTKLTSYIWGKKTGVINSVNQIISGIELDNMSQEEFNNSFARVNIYSKLTPDNKVKVIQAFKEKGAYIAFTSSGMEDITPAVNSDFNIIYNEEYGKTLRSFSDIAVKKDYIKNVMYIINRSKLYLKQIDLSLQFMLFSLIAMMLLSLIYIGMDKSFIDFSKVLWVSFFNLPLLNIIILLDNPKEYSIDNYKLTKKIKIVKPYLLGAFAACVIFLLEFIAKNYFGISMGSYLLFNLFMFLAVNKFRIGDKKIVSMANILYCITIVFNVVLIFIMNR